MYESPINLYMQEIMSKIENERENAITAKISESIGVDIDKGELIRALQYDRQQYNKGYADAKAEYESMLNEMKVEIKAMFPPSGDWMYNEGHEVEHTVCEVLVDVLQIIDKHRKVDKE